MFKKTITIVATLNRHFIEILDKSSTPLDTETVFDKLTVKKLYQINS